MSTAPASTRPTSRSPFPRPRLHAHPRPRVWSVIAVAPVLVVRHSQMTMPGTPRIWQILWRSSSLWRAERQSTDSYPCLLEDHHGTGYERFANLIQIRKQQGELTLRPSDPCSVGRG